LRRPLSDSEGSTPLELVMWLTLLLLPVGPMLALYGQLSNQLAAESIARHALRGTILSITDPSQLPSEMKRQLAPLQASWGKQISSYTLSCGNCARGSIITLKVLVGSAEAVQSAAMAPR
jgi:hypothetical protein